jgi:hypothetical protein
VEQSRRHVGSGSITSIALGLHKSTLARPTHPASGEAKLSGRREESFYVPTHCQTGLRARSCACHNAGHGARHCPASQRRREITYRQALKSNGAVLQTALSDATIKVKVKCVLVILKDNDPDARNPVVIAPNLNRGNKQIGHRINRVLRPVDL